MGDSERRLSNISNYEYVIGNPEYSNARRLSTNRDAAYENVEVNQDRHGVSDAAVTLAITDGSTANSAGYSRKSSNGTEYENTEVFGKEVKFSPKQNGIYANNDAAKRKTGTLKSLHFYDIQDGDLLVPVGSRSAPPTGWVPGKNDSNFGITFKEHSKFTMASSYAYYVLLEGKNAKRMKFSQGCCDNGCSIL